MLQSAADISAMYAALGEPVTPAAGSAFFGVFDAVDVTTFDGDGLAGDFELRYPAQTSLAVGAVLTLRGTQYRVVSDPQRVEDGLVLSVRLRKVTA